MNKYWYKVCDNILFIVLGIKKVIKNESNINLE